MELDLLRNPETLVNSYFSRLLSGDGVQKLRDYVGPLDGEFFSVKGDWRQKFDLYYSLPKFNLFQSLFNNCPLDIDPSFEMAFSVDCLQKSVALTLPKSTDLYWQFVRRRMDFTEDSPEPSSYDPSWLIDLDNLFLREDYGGLDELVMERVEAEIERGNRCGKIKIPLSRDTNYLLLEENRVSSGVFLRRFKTPFGETVSYWDLNSRSIPNLLGYSK